jgi:hypothetical protein
MMNNSNGIAMAPVYDNDGMHDAQSHAFNRYITFFF